MNNQIILALEASLLLLNEHVKQSIQIEEIITRTESQSFDRHLCTRSRLQLILNSRVGVATSGGRLMIDGQSGYSYEICADVLSAVEINGKQLNFVERLAPDLHRHSQISLLESLEN